jgi:hypothetical protein
MDEIHITVVSTVYDTVAIYSVVVLVRSEPSDFDRTVEMGPN